MKTKRPSRTAHLVALGRAMADAGLSHVPDFRDPTARVFLNDKGKQSLAKIELAIRSEYRSTRLEMARVMADLIAAGARQLVILGAGYDDRAWRMPELAGVKVFEIDHPATQNDKRAHVAKLSPGNAVVTFVAINFERESLSDSLERAGNDRALPTCWIWEGVVMYLTRAAMRATLADIGRRSAPGSTLIVNYHTKHRRFLAQLILRLIGEPQISNWSPEEMAADLHSVGFVVREDTAMADWNARFAQGNANIDRAPYMGFLTKTAKSQFVSKPGILGAGGPFCPRSHSRLRITAGSAYQRFAENCKRPSSSAMSSANAHWRD